VSWDLYDRDGRRIGSAEPAPSGFDVLVGILICGAIAVGLLALFAIVIAAVLAPVLLVLGFLVRRPKVGVPVALAAAIWIGVVAVQSAEHAREISALEQGLTFSAAGEIAYPEGPYVGQRHHFETTVQVVDPSLRVKSAVIDFELVVMYTNCAVAGVTEPVVAHFHSVGPVGFSDGKAVVTVSFSTSLEGETDFGYVCRTEEAACDGYYTCSERRATLGTSMATSVTT
jgi:hypothetical protein